MEPRDHRARGGRRHPGEPFFPYGSMRPTLPPARARRAPLLAALALALTLPASAAVITVDSGTDNGVGCTLREAVASANTDTAVGGCTAGDDANDEIRFSVGTVTLTQGQLVITEEVFVDASSMGGVTINASPGSRIVQVDGSEFVSFSSVTFVGGRAALGGALYVPGGASVAVGGCEFSDNSATLSGGAVWVSAGATFSTNNTSFRGNQARGDAANQGGGAIYTDGGDLYVFDTPFFNNRALGAAGSGGAILNPNGALLQVNATFNSNRAQRAGGAVETVGGTSNVSGTFVRNAVGSAPGNGGAIHGAGGVDLTVSGSARQNRAVEGGAFWIGAGSTLRLEAISVNDNIAEGDDADQGGGGVYVDGGTLVVANGFGGTPSGFGGNRAVGAAGSGGAVLVNGGTVSIEFASFSSNRAQRAGGAIEVVSGDVSALGAVFLANVAGTAPGNGGAIHTTSGPTTLDLDNVRFNNNEAGAEGGALWINAGTTLDLSESVLFGNLARGQAAGNGGGGVFNNGGDATISTTTIAGSRTFGQNVPGGGVLAVAGTTTLSQSLLLNNQSNVGGGLAALAGATVTVENSTIYGNAARFGGGVYSASGTITFDSATIAENTADSNGGGLFNQNPPNQGSPFVTLTNTIVADNSAPNGADLAGRHGSGGFNVIGTTPSASTLAAQPSDQLGTDPMLGPLDSNGGETQTAAPMSGSPAIDAGQTALAVDQRGTARSDGADDVGAVERVDIIVGQGGSQATAAASSLAAGMDAPVRLGVTPNPFGARASAAFAVREAQPVTVALYDVMGRRVQELFTGEAPAEATVEVAVDGSSLAAGVYVVVLQGATVRATRQVTVVR